MNFTSHFRKGINKHKELGSHVHGKPFFGRSSNKFHWNLLRNCMFGRIVPSSTNSSAFTVIFKTLIYFTQKYFNKF